MKNKMKKFSETVLLVKQYLNLWQQTDTVPDKIVKDSTAILDFSSVDLLKEKLSEMCSTEYLSVYYISDDKVSKEDVVYALGILLYYKNTGVKYNGEQDIANIKHVGLYQFYSYTLFIEPQYRVTSSRYLLTLLDLINTDISSVENIGENHVEIFSSIGLKRTQNQDFYDWVTNNNYTLLVIADGMGGGEDGDVASRLATDTTIEYIYSFYKDSLDADGLNKMLRASLLEANSSVLKYAKEKSIKKIGTTLSLALIRERQLFIAHLGDSRIYMKKDGEFKQLTQDHSYPEVLYRLGEITKEEKKEYKKNLLVYLVGKEDLKEEDIYTLDDVIDIDNTLTLFMCSDGVWENIDPEYFDEEFESLNRKIMQTTPNDNVSYIRYRIIDRGNV